MDKQECRDLLEEVVEGVLSGKLNHDQAVFHWENYHCVAGWFEVKYAQKHGVIYDSDEEFFKKDNLKHGIYYDDFSTNTHACKISELTGYDEELLDRMFSSFATKEDIRKIWRGLKCSEYSK